MTLVTVVVPVADDSRNELLDKLLTSLESQTYRDFEVILVVGDNRQGRAINKAVREARGKWIVTFDDDSHVEDDRLLDKLVSQMEADDSIGMGGASCIIPDWATDFQKKAMRQLKRRWFPVQQTVVDSDFVQHPCLIISRGLFLEIGGEDEELVRGLDPVLRKKVRDAGKRVCILADVAVAHLLPDGMTKLFHMFRRNGRGSAFAQRFFPARVLELTDGHDGGAFVEQRPLIFRIVRRISDFLTGVVSGKFIKQATDLAYVLGWIEGYVFGQFPESKGVIRYGDEETDEDRGYPIRRYRVLYNTNTIEDQIARLHISSDRTFVLGTDPHPDLPFYKDKVGVYKNFAGEGFLYEMDEQGEVTGFLFLLMFPGRFKKKLLVKGYGFRYILAVLSGRYRNSLQGWRKWIRLPLAFLQRPKNSPGSGGAKIVAFVVREELRGQGIGSKLLVRAEELALSFGRHSLEVTVVKDNEGALRLYERNGFERTDEVLESSGDCWYLEKAIGVP